MADRLDYLKVGEHILRAGSVYAGGVNALGHGAFRGQQYRQNAQRALDAGAANARDIRAQGRQTASEALVAMVAQGGTVDSEMLARIKGQSDIDAISAMYDAKVDAMTQKYAARAEELQGRREYRASMLGVGSNILSAASSYPWKPAKPATPATGGK